MFDVDELDREARLYRKRELVALLNRFSLLFHGLLSCIVCFIIEWMSRHSFAAAVSFVTARHLVFLYNSLIIFVSLMFVYLFQRRAVMRCIICTFWLLLGTINGCVLAKRVSPFGYTDLKMIGDLFAMQSNYFSAAEAVLAIVALAGIFVFLMVLWFRGPKYKGRIHYITGVLSITCMILAVPTVTQAAIRNHVLAEYFGNLAQGYRDYGFIYSFSASVIDRGMHAPENYSEETIHRLLQMTENDEQTADLEPVEKTRTTSADAVSLDTDEKTVSQPNIICVLLESFVDPEEVLFLELSEDPVPNFRYLRDHFSGGYLTVPVVGAGTANTEFEVLTGMSMQFFGLGEYPYKTILKKTNCESIASDLSRIGYGTHAVHNNGGNFYSRRNVFSMLGFDTFTCKEMMDIREYTPLGTWPTDHILVGEVEKSLDYTPDQPDFIYTITVQSHGDYPREPVLEDPEIRVSGAETEEENYAWEYYVNMIHEVDRFIADLIEMVSARDEKTVIVLFGDHLPTMGLTEEDMAAGNLFLTQYVTWDNLGLEKEDADITSYQLLARIQDQLGLHEGTMFRYHQNRDRMQSQEEYIGGLELLQYDILYGGHYVYDGKNPYPATDLIMGTQDVVISELKEYGKYLYVIGSNFTKWSKVFANDTKISTKYLSSHIIRVAKEKLESGENHIVVKQVGSSSSIFRVSNETVWMNEEETETESETGTELSR